MAENRKSIIDEAVADAKRLQETLNANTKEILRSIAKEEINDLVKESLNEFDEEDVDDTEVGTDVETDANAETEVDADTEVDAEVPADDSIEGVDDAGMDDSEEGGLDDYETGMGAEVPNGEEEIDMTSASDDEVIAVYKKLTGDDEIQIVSNENGDIELTVNEPGEFVIKANGAGKPAAPANTGMNDMDDMDSMVPEVPVDDTAGIDGLDDLETYEEGLDVNESQVVYEIAIDEMEDIESVSAPVGKENNWAGDNLEGGFDDKGQNGTGDSHGEHIMEDEDVEEELDENLAQTRGAEKHAGQYTGAAHNPKATNEYVSKADYDKLLAEARKLKNTANQMTSVLKEQRTLLAKVGLFNANLTNVTRLFTEHSTTKDEKKNIIERFDEEVTTIQESKRLFKTIENELGNKKPISESLEEKLSKEKSGSSSKLNESTAYVDQGTKRIMDLMKRVENPDKY
jgi:hypothetical protein